MLKYNMLRRFTLREIVEGLNDSYTFRDEDIIDCIECLVDMIDEGEALKNVVGIIVDKVRDTKDD